VRGAHLSLANSFARAKRGASEDPRRAKHLRLAPRAQWLADLKQCTALVREQKARELEARSRAVGLEKRRAWREAKNVWREERTDRTVDRGDRVHRAGLEQGEALRVFNDPRARGGKGDSYVDREWEGLADLEERLAGAPELGSRWHLSRAEGKRELFERVNRCGDADAHQITLVCRSCKTPIEIEVGCNSHWFCPSCRARTANKFRADFERKRLGLVTAATRAGLTRRRQKKSERWGERLLTLTLPHDGDAGDRVRVLRATWSRFWRTLREVLRPELQKRSGITLTEVPRGMSERAIAQRQKRAQESFDAYTLKRLRSTRIGPLEWKKRIEFFKAKPADRVPYKSDLDIELSLWDMLSYLHVFEWTPGADGLGHPHMHVWLFSRYIEQALLERLWREAYAHVTGLPLESIGKLVVDIRQAKPDVAHELVKYMTKDWEISDTGAKRAAPEVFAQVYAELADKRIRQSSAGFSNWALPKVVACPCCNFESQRGHWARVDIVHALEGETIAPTIAPADTTPAPLTAARDTQPDRELHEALAVRQALGKAATRGAELRAAWLARRRQQKGK